MAGWPLTPRDLVRGRPTVASRVAGKCVPSPHPPICSAPARAPKGRRAPRLDPVVTIEYGWRDPFSPVRMPLFLIRLDCASPTSHPDGEFVTVVRATTAEYRAGLHLKYAARRAAIVGFGGPHRVRELRRLGGIPHEEAGESEPEQDHDITIEAMRSRLALILRPERAAANDPVAGCSSEGSSSVPERQAQPVLRAIRC